MKAASACASRAFKRREHPVDQAIAAEADLASARLLTVMLRPSRFLRSGHMGKSWFTAAQVICLIKEQEGGKASPRACRSHGLRT